VIDLGLFDGNTVRLDFALLGVALFDEPLREGVFVVGASQVFDGELDFAFDRLLFLLVFPLLVLFAVEEGQFELESRGGDVAFVLRFLNLVILFGRLERRRGLFDGDLLRLLVIAELGRIELDEHLILFGAGPFIDDLEDADAGLAFDEADQGHVVSAFQVAALGDRDFERALFHRLEHQVRGLFVMAEELTLPREHAPGGSQQNQRYQNQFPDRSLPRV